MTKAFHDSHLEAPTSSKLSLRLRPPNHVATIDVRSQRPAAGGETGGLVGSASAGVDDDEDPGGDPRFAVLVTGGHGFIGSWVVRALLRRGHRVRCLLRTGSRDRRLTGLDVERVIGDILDPGSLAAAMKGIGACIHLAGISAYKDMQTPRAWPTIVEGTRHVLAAALDSGVTRMVAAGSGVIYGSRQPRGVCDETSPWVLGGSGLIYAEAKYAAALLVDDFAARGLQVCLALPMETYGPGDDDLLTCGYLKDAINSPVALATYGATSFAHVEDVAEGFVLALEKGRAGERYILGGDAASIKEIIELALDVAGCPNRVWRMPTAVTRAVLLALQALHLPSPEHPDAVAYGSLHSSTSSDKARRELGYAPRSGREVMTSTVAWMRAEGHLKPL